MGLLNCSDLQCEALLISVNKKTVHLECLLLPERFGFRKKIFRKLLPMKPISFIAILMCFALQSEAQLFKTFIGANGKPTDSLKATSFLLYQKQGDSLYAANLYTIQKKRIMSGSYKDVRLNIPHGSFFYYHIPTKGTIDSLYFLERSGTYNNGKKTGEWIDYFQNRQKKELFTFRNDTLNGLYENYSGQTYALMTKGTYQNGLPEGEWLTLSKSGNVIRKETFTKGRVTNTVVAPPMYKAPIPPDKFNSYLKERISGSIKSKIAASSGFLQVKLTVTKDGSLSNVAAGFEQLGIIKNEKYLTVDPENALRKETLSKITEIIASCPYKWTPGFDTTLNTVVEDNIHISLQVEDGNIKVVYDPEYARALYEMEH